MVLAPLSNNVLIILLNVVMMAGIMIHWALNDQTCCLTVLEKMLRGKDLDSETFFGNLLGPVYSANSTMYSWVFILILFSINIKKLHEKKEELRNIYKIILSNK